MAEDISFIIPAYNDAAGLERHFRYFTDARRQVQLVVVDDGSSDGTEALISRADLPAEVELTYHRMAVNSGPAAARNMGITLAGRERVMFLDADDLMTPDFFSVMALAPFAADMDFVMFKHHLSLSADQRFTYDMHPVDRAFFSHALEGTFPLCQARLKDRPQAPATINFPWNKLYRTSFLRDAGITFPDLKMNEDITVHWQSFLRCRTFGVLFWAPPLITHYEIPEGTRATQYVGDKRMPVFGELAQLEAEMLAHPDADLLTPVFREFCHDLFGWMAGSLCDGSGDKGQEWRPRYAAAAKAFWEASAVGQGNGGDS